MKYNHEESSVLKATGVDIDAVIKKANLLSSTTDKTKISEVMEIFETEFTARQLAFLVTKFITEKGKKESLKKLKKVLGKMKIRKSDFSKEEPQGIGELLSDIIKGNVPGVQAVKMSDLLSENLSPIDISPDDDCDCPACRTRRKLGIPKKSETPKGPMGPMGKA